MRGPSVSKFISRVVRLGTKSSLFLLTLLWVGTVNAHEVRPAIADVDVSGSEATISINLSIEPLMAGMNLAGLADTNDAPEAAKYDALRALEHGVLEGQVTQSWDDLRSGMQTQGMGPLELVSVVVTPEQDEELPRDTVLTIRADLPAGDAPVQFGWQAENGGLVVRHGDGDLAYAAFLEGGQLSAELPRIGSVQESSGQVFWRFLVSGFDHIIPKGLDHILFVLGLFMFSLAWRPLLSQVTAFTLAHTVTLGMATLGVINIPASAMWAVEALIALSITYVAVENILRPKLGWWRIAVVFGFGLLHGLGFASVLGDFGLAQGQFILSLIAFNVGVEIGQLAVIAVAVALILVAVRLAPFGKLPVEQTPVESVPVMHRAVSIVGSLIIAVIGIYWVIERTFL